LLEYLHTQGACLPIIVLTGHGDIPLAVQVLKMGAFDFIEKPAAQQQMLDRIRDALAADQAIRAKLSEQVRIASLLAQLTNREHEVLERVIAGQANKVIATELGISEKTVEKHREHIMKKMEARSLAELIQMTLLYRWSTGNP
jgi:two-component system, LuxR family, response regulator FixJ